MHKNVEKEFIRTYLVLQYVFIVTKTIFLDIVNCQYKILIKDYIQTYTIKLYKIL